MDLSDLDTVLNDDPLPRTRLANGVDPWEPAHYDLHELRAAAYRSQVERHGHTATCENCGRTWPIHPVNVGKSYACSQACKDVMYKARKRGDDVRPANPLPWRPWAARGKK